MSKQSRAPQQAPQHDPVFVVACALADRARGANPPTAPTRRQWRKWTRGYGSAYAFAAQACQQVAERKGGGA